MSTGSRHLAAILVRAARGWLQRLRDRAEPLRQQAIGELNWPGF